MTGDLKMQQLGDMDKSWDIMSSSEGAKTSTVVVTSQAIF